MSNLRKCEICGNLVTFVNDTGVPLFCCGEEMTKVEVIKGDEGVEKHKPIVIEKDDEIIIRVGSTLHPMDDDHFIMLIQLLDGEKVIAGKKLESGDMPEFTFNINPNNVKDLKARAYCNKHGLWES